MKRWTLLIPALAALPLAAYFASPVTAQAPPAQAAARQASGHIAASMLEPGGHRAVCVTIAVMIVSQCAECSS